MLIAGPWVSSAITNQFNTVAGTLGNGISKGSWESGGTGGGNGSLTDADIVDPVHGIAFAVYSEDDHSLMFYKRRGVPRVGDMLNSRRVTAVYTGFENGYATATVGNDGKTTAPWWPNRNNIVAVKAIDDGMEIHSLAFCFQYMENCKSFDLAKFDMSNCTNLQHAFAYCGNATSFSISSWDTSSVVEFDSALKNLYKVEEIDISGWSTRKAGDLRLLFPTDSSLKSVKFGPGWKTSDVMDMLGMFSYCKNLNLNCLPFLGHEKWEAFFMRVDLRVKHDVEARKAAIGLFELGRGYKSAAIALSLPAEAVRRWQEIYRAFGSEVLLRMDGKQGRYTYEQKVAAASAVVDGGMTKAEAMAAFGIMSMSPLKKWCALYSRGGAEALRPRPKGRPSGSRARPRTREQELEERCRRLEAEVAYLKKWLC